MKLLGRALLTATAAGTVLQLIMVTTGHSNMEVRGIFAVGGMGISGVAGILYAVMSEDPNLRDLLLGGAIAGGLCAFIGILVSCILGDVPATLLVIGTASSVVTGAIGGWIGRLFATGRV